MSTNMFCGQEYFFSIALALVQLNGMYSVYGSFPMPSRPNTALRTSSRMGMNRYPSAMYANSCHSSHPRNSVIFR